MCQCVIEAGQPQHISRLNVDVHAYSAQVTFLQSVITCLHYGVAYYNCYINLYVKRYQI